MQLKSLYDLQDGGSPAGVLETALDMDNNGEQRLLEMLRRDCKQFLANSETPLYRGRAKSDNTIIRRPIENKDQSGWEWERFRLAELVFYVLTGFEGVRSKSAFATTNIGVASRFGGTFNKGVAGDNYLFFPIDGSEYVANNMESLHDIIEDTRFESFHYGINIVSEIMRSPNWEAKMKEFDSVRMDGAGFNVSVWDWAHTVLDALQTEYGGLPKHSKRWNDRLVANKQADEVMVFNASHYYGINIGDSDSGDTISRKDYAEVIDVILNY